MAADITAILNDKTIAETGEALLDAMQSGKVLVSEITDILLRKAVMTNSSDVHVEPTSKGLRIRYRVDGVFQDLGPLPIKLHEQLVTRLKVMADLATHRRETVQEGRISTEVDGERRDFRVSIVPAVSGEKVVLRMFSPTEGLFDLHALGYPPDLVAKLEALLFDMKGMVVLTGPSGSGKTTTLYASLMRLYEEKDRFASICTIEDPVEYEFGLFSKIPVNRKIGLDFAAALSAVLRQDPEAIMIGEIRDLETCDIALRAGLTGHLVLTTIHSGSAVDVVTRLLNMDIEAFVVASALTGVVAQRLARRICTACKESFVPPKSQVDFVERSLNRSGLKFMRGKGCAECAGTGYSGRVPLAELLVFDDPLRSLILEEPSSATLKKFAIGRGMRTILDDGLDKVAAGVTTLDEVFRVAGYSQELSK